MYAIIDIETTGGSPKFEKITEIAIILHDGSCVKEEYATLVNPEKAIPYHITNLTGISNEMVADAPKFYEIAKKVVQMTDGCVFVAHNVNFDYRFVKEEFARLGYDFKRNTLCTVKLSRKIIPGKRSYSLGNLCDELGIIIKGRHRAMGDALATAKLFDILLSVESNAKSNLFQPQSINKQSLHPAFDVSCIANLPGKTGVYYFRNECGDIIYVGKSNDIQTRVISHFSNNTTQKAIKMKSQIVSIDYEITGSELVALLLESEEIKKNKPIYNHAQRRTPSHCGIFQYTDANGYICLSVENNELNNSSPLTSFNTKAEAREFMSFLIQRYHLCQKLCGLYKSAGACFQHQLGECTGACCGAESPDVYNLRVQKALNYFEYDTKSFFVLDKGRSNDEISVVQIRNGKYIGFGYVSREIAYSNGIESLCDCIRIARDNREVQQIIKHHIRKYKVEKIIPY
ncbi:MAG TPA: exonuclease domain-containing protein [Bacteroidales bacterium]|nr:exonuclease domain-containing protein [Bacteroidales bacterium]